jgi:hypothetical protein
MASQLFDWESKGFGAPPEPKIAGDGGVLLYRCWGVPSTEWGTGYFSLEKPTSVIDAELCFNIIDWGNGVNFVSTFRLKKGFLYWAGPVGHGPHDTSRPATQVLVDVKSLHGEAKLVQSLQTKIELVKSKELLKHDAYVVNQNDPGPLNKARKMQ